MLEEYAGGVGVFVTKIRKIERIGCCARITFDQVDRPAITIVVPLYATYDIGRELQQIKDPPCLAGSLLVTN